MPELTQVKDGSQRAGLRTWLPCSMPRIPNAQLHYERKRGYSANQMIELGPERSGPTPAPGDGWHSSRHNHAPHGDAPSGTLEYAGQGMYKLRHCERRHFFSFLNFLLPGTPKRHVKPVSGADTQTRTDLTPTHRSHQKCLLLEFSVCTRVLGASATGILKEKRKIVTK
ncbi:hypothetical protein Q7C36_017986 [Tachysurus vachellii]|uniref:Uncharacterized protein n=1 Tax=Tachysurus vachellii TaxID=175792 RepID=A0AA88LZA9_TACVA|nr:hypothetical protein Q7C36_017986 [Tachysurus vachellii]